MDELLKEILEKHEGKKRRKYKCTAGRWTIGIGHNMEDEPLPEEMQRFLDSNGYITDEMIYELLEKDIEDAINDAWDLYPNLESYSEARQAALIDFLFNVGKRVALQFKRLNRAVNEEKWDNAAKYLLESKYARQVGQRAQTIARMLREG
jgi:lysozyme